MLSIGAKICLHIDYEDMLEKGLERPAIIRKLVKTWSLTANEVEDIIREQEEFLTMWGKGVIV